MKSTAMYRFSYSLFYLLLCVTAPINAQENEVLSRIIEFQRGKETVYRLLGQITEKTGYLFIYDSKLVNNNRVVKLKAGSRTIRKFIHEIVADDRLQLRIVGNHILIYLPVASEVRVTKEPRKSDNSSSLLLEGMLLDKQTQEPIPYGTVSVAGTSIGCVTNQDGGFRLQLSDTLRSSSIHFSHLGYVPQSIEASLLIECNNTISLEPKIVPIQEVIIRIVNPMRLLSDMMQHREDNYSLHPVYFTSFYREGVDYKNKFMNLTEAVFKIYKPPYRNNEISDQVKLLKMRRITNNSKQDTLIAKMRSGIHACLSLDIIKNLPEFLFSNSWESNYVYFSKGMTVTDNRLAHVVSFEQRKDIKDPLYRGELYIDSENNALLGARYEVNPKHINRAANMFVEKKSRNISIIPKKVVYTVSYKSWDNTYYINHVRGDLYFKVRKKKLFPSSSTLHTWFEMMTCKIDTEQVNRFPRNEKLSTRTIFSDTHFSYDNKFWGDFNVILPEGRLSDAIQKISAKIEETGY